LDELAADGRALTIHRSDSNYWVATERASQSDDPNAVVSGWMESLGPSTTSALSAKIGFPIDAVESALFVLEAQGQVLQGRFRNAVGEIEWCNRRILARIHRATLGKLRREIEPVTALDFERFLQLWQHVSRGSQLHGADGTLHIIRRIRHPRP
jgi:ATP-dependent Lhr-like helicase